jgi:hypothetical protein
MAQYKDGTVDVVNGSQNVTGIGTKFLSNVVPGGMFVRRGTLPVYIVGSVTDDTHLALTAPYAGTTASGIEYSVSQDFTTIRNLPLMNNGDVDTPAIFNRAMQIIDGLL